MRPTDILKPANVAMEVSVVRKDRNFVRFEGNKVVYNKEVFPPTVLEMLDEEARRSPNDLMEVLFAMKAFGVWASDGPKSFYPTPEQCEALENVSMNISITDYRQPYPAMAVVFPKPLQQMYGTRCIVIYHESGNEFILASCGLEQYTYSSWCIGRGFDPKLEEALDAHEHYKLGYRVAINSLLAMTYFGQTTSPMYPHDVERDRRLAQEQTERGLRARERLSCIPLRVSFSQNVVLASSERLQRTPGDPTGREVTCHWRRGHWAMQPCGPGLSLRKMVFRRPTMVRADLFVGDHADTSSTYKIKGSLSES